MIHSKNTHLGKPHPLKGFLISGTKHKRAVWSHINKAVCVCGAHGGNSTNVKRKLTPNSEQAETKGLACKYENLRRRCPAHPVRKTPSESWKSEGKKDVWGEVLDEFKTHVFLQIWRRRTVREMCQKTVLIFDPVLTNLQTCRPFSLRARKSWDKAWAKPLKTFFDLWPFKQRFKTCWWESNLGHDWGISCKRSCSCVKGRLQARIQQEALLHLWSRCWIRTSWSSLKVSQSRWPLFQFTWHVSVQDVNT